MEYYNIAVDGAGLATVADSFAALEQRCEKEQRLSWDEVRAACADDFAAPGEERIRCILASTPL